MGAFHIDIFTDLLLRRGILPVMERNLDCNTAKTAKPGNSRGPCPAGPAGSQ
jgi:hypothetical protein